MTVKELNKKHNWNIPEYCPECGAETQVSSSGDVFCPNESCSKKIEHCFNKFFDVLDIKGGGIVFIDKIVKKGYDSTIFNLIDAINFKDKDKILKIYNELLEENETEEKILYTIANHYRLLLQIKIQSKDKSDSEIISEYKMHPYRLTKLKEQCSLVSYEMILKILKSLSEIDIEIKSGKKSISTGMCLFFENL